MGFEDGDGRSLSERAADGEGFEPEPELFPMGSVDGDVGVTVKTLIKAGLPVEFTMAMRSAEVPVRGDGMLHPDRQASLLVVVEAGKAEEIPQREGEFGEKRIVGWKVRQHLRPVHIRRVESDAAELEAGFAILADSDPQAAGRLLERLQANLAQHLQAA